MAGAVFASFLGDEGSGEKIESCFSYIKSISEASQDLVADLQRRS